MKLCEKKFCGKHKFDALILSLPSVIFLLGQELSAKPFSLLSTKPRNLDPRTVVLKEDLLAMKDTARSSGSLFI